MITEEEHRILRENEGKVFADGSIQANGEG